MLTANEEFTMAKAAAHLSGAKPLSPQQVQELVNEMHSLLLTNTATRANMGRPKGSPNKRQLSYIVECAPLWATTVRGAKAAAALVNETLKENGMAQVTAHNLAVQLSRNGQWARAIETDNGTLMLTVEKEQTGTSVA